MYNIRMNYERGLRLTSLNIEGDLHLNLVLPFLKQKDSDVVCLQEVLEKDIKSIEEYTGMRVLEYVPLTHFTGPNVARMPEDSTWGILYLVRKEIEIVDSKVEHYKKDGAEIPEYHSDDPNCVDRAIIAATISKDGVPYRIITTHFTWSPNGQAIHAQERDMQALLGLLKEEKEFVFCGDTNAPRGGKIWEMLASNYQDNIPERVHTTLDRTLHKAADRIGDYVVDCLFSTSAYRTESVEVSAGISDHMAISGVIFRR